MIRTTLDAAETQLRDLVDAALRGEEVVIATDGDQGERIVRIVAEPSALRSRRKDTIRVTAADAITQLPDLARAAIEGHQVLVTLPGEQEERAVLLIAMAPFGTPPRSGFGSLKGQITIAEDFDDPIPGFEEYQ